MEEDDRFDGSGAGTRTAAYMHFEEIAEAAALESIRLSEQRMLLQDLKDYLHREVAKFAGLEPGAGFPQLTEAISHIRLGLDLMTDLVEEAWEYGPGWDEDEWISILLEAKRADDQITRGSEMLLQAQHQPAQET